MIRSYARNSCRIINIFLNRQSNKLILDSPKSFELLKISPVRCLSTENSSPFSIQDSSSNGNHSDAEARNKYELIANETLESLTDKFESIGEKYEDVLTNDFDVNFSNGVLNVKLGGTRGTYVLNKQTPNLQIWLSSPVSGPKRFDLVDNKKWIYNRTGECLHDLLAREISENFGDKINFEDCAFSGTNL